MTEAERFDRVCSIFDQVRKLESEQQQDRLIELCSRDEDILKEVQDMLGMHRLESPLDQPSNLPSLDSLMSKERLDHVPQIDRYEVGERIGEGGMGVVYAAEMRNPRRAVAIKVIRLGMDSERVIARFELERQALARMEHPNIASVIDAGLTSDGRPYFTMELVRGQTIVRHIKETRLDTKARIELVIQVCKAIQHAHQKGVIHRDIKPSNIVVTQSDGRMIPKVIDFGIAKATGDDLLSDATMTVHNQALGTPAYMSPEQADQSVGDVDTRTDVYSLGVVLYELLTGSTPITKRELTEKSYQELIQCIREQDPPRPSVRLATTKLDGIKWSEIDPAQLKGDLDWIIMKCLEKDPGRRYETVSALGDDLARFLRDEPVFARPASRAYLVRKFVRRHRGGVIAASIVVGTLLLGIAGTTAGLVWAINEKERAEELAEAEFKAQTEAKQSSELAIREAEAAEDISEFFILDVLASVDPSRSADRDLTVRDALINASENLEGKFEDRPDVESRIHNALGFLFGQLGSPELAEKHHIREWEIAEAENGELSIDAARMMHSVVGSLARQGRDIEAIELTRRQLRVIDGLGTPEAEALRPRAVGNLGALMVRAGQHQEAAPILEETLVLKREFYGDRHPTTLSTLNNLSSVLTKIGELDRAIMLASEAYQGREEVLGANDPRTFVSLLNFASALTDAERFEESLPMLRDGVQRAQGNLGTDHPTTIDISNTYARSLLDHGDFEESERVAESSVQIQNQHDPDMIHQRTLSANSLLASSLNRQSKHEEALQYTSAIIFKLKESDRGKSILLSQYLRLHGQVLSDLGQFHRAELIFLEAWEHANTNGRRDSDIQYLLGAIINMYEEWLRTEPSVERKEILNSWKNNDNAP